MIIEMKMILMLGSFVVIGMMILAAIIFILLHTLNEERLDTKYSATDPVAQRIREITSSDIKPEDAAKLVDKIIDKE